jgi:tetratricopeptide (TPR) repeat protein
MKNNMGEEKKLVGEFDDMSGIEVISALFTLAFRNKRMCVDGNDRLASYQRSSICSRWSYRGCAKLRLEKYKSAIDDFNLAISSNQSLSPDHEIQVLYKRGYAHYKCNQFDSVLDDYRRFLTRCEQKNQNDLKHKGLFGIGCISSVQISSKGNFRNFQIHSSNI